MKPEKKVRTYQGAVSVVMGAASGFGLGLGEELTRQGSEVILADRQGKHFSHP